MSDSNDNSNGSVANAAVPKWIEAKLFENLLKELEPQFKEIVQFKVGNALAPGENYATVMLKVEIEIKLKDGTTKPTSFMLKVGHDNDLFRQLMEMHDVFAVESGMYTEIMPEFEKLYADAGVNVQFGAKAYKLPIDQPYILLENLKTKGFRNANRLEGFDMQHMHSVLKKLAQWHAASAVRVERKGMYDLMYRQGFVKPESYDVLKQMFDGAGPVLLEAIKELPNSQSYYDKVKTLHSRMTEEVLKMNYIDENEFNVLNHGDCWSNNIMFQYDEKSGELKETYLVDLQLPRYSRPSQDLIYCILSSCKYELKLKEFDNLVHYYHTNLVACLKLLNYQKKIPTLKDLHCMILKDGLWCYCTVVNVMAAVLCEPSDGASLDNFMNDTEDGLAFKRLMYFNSRYQKHAAVLFPWLLNRGALEFE